MRNRCRADEFGIRADSNIDTGDNCSQLSSTSSAWRRNRNSPSRPTSPSQPDPGMRTARPYPRPGVAPHHYKLDAAGPGSCQAGPRAASVTRRVLPIPPVRVIVSQPTGFSSVLAGWRARPRPGAASGRRLPVAAAWYPDGCPARRSARPRPPGRRPAHRAAAQTLQRQLRLTHGRFRGGCTAASASGSRQARLPGHRVDNRDTGLSRRLASAPTPDWLTGARPRHG